jgi:hypothetical protein
VPVFARSLFTKAQGAPVIAIVGKTGTVKQPMKPDKQKKAGEEVPKQKKQRSEAALKDANIKASK